jgi:hypothetical protein
MDANSVTKLEAVYGDPEARGRLNKLGIPEITGYLRPGNYPDSASFTVSEQQKKFYGYLRVAPKTGKNGKGAFAGAHPKIAELLAACAAAGLDANGKPADCRITIRGESVSIAGGQTKAGKPSFDLYAGPDAEIVVHKAPNGAAAAPAGAAAAPRASALASGGASGGGASSDPRGDSIEKQCAAKVAGELLADKPLDVIEAAFPRIHALVLAAIQGKSAGAFVPPAAPAGAGDDAPYGNDDDAPAGAPAEDDDLPF